MNFEQQLIIVQIEIDNMIAQTIFADDYLKIFDHEDISQQYLRLLKHKIYLLKKINSTS